MASLAFPEYEWSVDRPGGGRVTATRSAAETVIWVDRTREAPVPAGAKLLSSFLDDLTEEFGDADGMALARMEIAVEQIEAKGGATLRDLRMTRGLTQKQFADELGTSQSRVSNLEARNEKPSEDTLRAMTEVLNVDFNTLMEALRRGD
jgi:DNA-binding transcriptional regulator YiaG